MKIKTVALSFLTVAFVLLSIHGFSVAQPLAPEPPHKIGLVSVAKVMQNCKATAKFGERRATENNEMSAAEDKLSGEIRELQDNLRAGALVPSSNDYLEQWRQLLQKQADLKALQEFNTRRMGIRERAWAEKIYKEVLRITKEVAATRGLDMVLERSEPTFPIPPDQLMTTLSTHKVLYGGGCLDITDEVIAKLDSMESELVD